MARVFQDKWQFPNCIGTIDEKHIYIQSPAKSGSAYHNYTSRFSVLLMSVVDANFKFIYVNVGIQGRVSDGGIFGQLVLRAVMNRCLLNILPLKQLPGTNITVPYAFVEDEAFPLRTDLVKPNPYGNLYHGQRIVNYQLLRARHTVQKAFGILANRQSWDRELLFGSEQGTECHNHRQGSTRPVEGILQIQLWTTLSHLINLFL